MATFKDVTVKNAKTLIPYVKPNWGADLPQKDLKATWLGHACTLVEMPVAAYAEGNTGGQRGVRVLFDPVLGSSMAFWGLGPARESSELLIVIINVSLVDGGRVATPCEIEEIPEIDIIVSFYQYHSNDCS